MNELNKI